MSYFNFDLQLFADEAPTPVTVELTDAVKSALQGNSAVTYVLCKKDDTVSWKTTSGEGDTVIAKAEVAVNDEAETPTYTRTLTIAAEAKAEVTISGAAMANLKDVTVATVADLSVETPATTVTTTKFSDASFKAVEVNGSTFTVKEAGIEIGKDVSVTATNGTDTFVIKETADGKKITVSTAGVVNAVDAGAVFTIADGSNDALATTYTIGTDSEGKSTISVSGDYVGAYTALTREGLTITPKADAQDTIKPAGEETLTSVGFAEGKGTLTLDGTSVTTKTTKYFAITVNSDGKFEIATDETTGALDASANYFAVTYDPKGGLNATVTVELIAGNKETAQLLESVAINAAKADKVGSTAVTAINVATGLATGKVTVTGVPTTADITIAGKTYTYDDTTATNKAASVTYTKTFAVASTTGAANIDLSKAAAAGTYFFLIKTTDANNHGKQNCIVDNTNVVNAESLTGDNLGKAAFKVVVGDGGNYAVSFAAGNGTAGPANLNDAGWKNITVDANTVAVGKTVAITSQGTTADADATNDNYTVNNAKVGVTVTLTKASGTGVADGSSLIVNRVAGETLKTTLIYDDSEPETASTTKITMPSGTGAATEYWLVTKDAEASNTGHPTITIKKADAKPADSASYITVARDASGNVTVTYNNGASIALTGLTTDGTTPAKVALDKGSLAAGNTLTLTDTGAVVDYTVADLPLGVTVVGAGTSDSISRATGTCYKNDVTLKLSETTDATKPKYYTVTAVTGDNAVDASTGLTKLTVGSATETEPTAENTSYFKVTVDASGNYTVNFVKKGTGVDLKNAVGKTTINATGVASTANITLSTMESTNQVVSGYTVTNVVKGYEGTIKVDTFDVTDGTPQKNSSSWAVSYAEPYTNELAADSVTLALHNSTATKYKVSKTFNRGVWEYKVGATTEALGANDSYFEVSYDSEKKTATINFVPKDGGVTYAEFAKNLTTPIKVDGSGVGTDATTLVLTPDSTDGAIEYAVINLPKNVTTVTNAAGTGDSVSYTQTYKFADGANKIALTADDGITYYEVTATGGDAKSYGVNTCSIATEALKTTGNDDAAKEASIASKNYFKVEKKADGTVTITYHKAVATDAVKEPKVLELSSDMEVDVNPSAAGNVNITCGATGASDTNLTYNVKGLSKGQTAVAATATGDKVNVEYNVSYEITGKITLADNLTGQTKYFKVVRTEPVTTGTSAIDADKQGVAKFAITACTETEAKAAAAYFMVNYSSQYQVNVTYVNPTGANYDLTVDGVPQVEVDADALTTSTTTKIDTINIADTTGGDYNGVNYALTNVPNTVTVIDTNRTDGKLDAKDTVSYKEAAVLADGASITIDPSADVMYYAVTGTVTQNSIICSVDSTGTATEPADTVNYFMVTKSGGNYEVTYHMANGTGYSFSAANLTVNAANVTVSPNTTTTPGTSAPGSLTITTNGTSMTGVTSTVTNAAGGVTHTGGVISHSTTFAWTPGTYYVKLVDGKADIKNGVLSGATVAGSDDQYVAMKVTTVTTGEGDAKKVTYKIAAADGKVYKADATTGVMTAQTSPALTVGNLNLTLDAAIKDFDAGNVAYGTIAGVTKDDVLAGINTGTIITTDSLKANDVVTINLNGATSDTSFKAGADGAITFKGNSVTNGVILLDAENAAAGESKLTDAKDSVESVTLVTAAAGTKAGVTVTFAEGEITSITGLDDGDQITVAGKDSSDNAISVTYGYVTVDGKRYIAKADGTSVTYAAVPTDTAKTNVLTMAFAESTSMKVGTFAPTATSGTFYAKLDTSNTANVTLAASTTEADPVSGTYYAKITMGAGSAITGLSIVKGNSSKLVDTATDYTGTITIPAGLFTNSVVKYTGTPDTGYKVAFTGVGAGSTFTNLDSDDTIVTGELGGTDTITIDGNVYTAVGASTDKQTFKFSGNQMTQGTVTLAAGSTLTAADGTIISYTAATATDGVTVVFGEKGITSLTGLTNGEKVTLTATDADGNVTTTVYEATVTDGSTVTRTVTKDGKSVTDTLTIPVDATTGQSNILAVEDVTSSTIAVGFAFANSTSTSTVGYITESSSGLAAGAREFTVPQTSGNVPLKKGMVVIKAESTYDATNGVTLEFTPMVSDASGNLNPASLYGDTVKVTAPSAKIVYKANTTYKVAFENVVAGSSLNINQEGSTIETADLADGTSIKVNGQTITDKAGAATTKTKLYVASATDVRVVDGTVIVTGELKGEDTTTASEAKLASTVSYTAGEDNTNGVVVTYAAGLATAITGLEVGETVTVKNGSVTTTYTAAKADPSDSTNKTIIWKTVSGDSTAANNGTKVISIANGTDVVSGTYGDLADLKSTDGFSTKYNSEATATNTGYFLVDADSNTLTIADVAKGTTIATYKDVGKTLVKAAIAADGTLTLTKHSVDINGNVSSTAGTFAAGDVAKATIKVSGGQTIKYEKATGVDSVAITGVGNGSEFTGFAAGDTVETISLNPDATVVFKNGTTTKTYTAGGTGKLVFDGTAAKTGTFKVGTDVFNATNTVDSTKVTTDSTIAYTAGTATGAANDGVNVTISNGIVQSITGLGLDEQVVYTQIVTAKDGSTTTKKVTYKAADKAVESGAQKGSIVVTKTEEVDGKSTTYTQTFSSDSLDVTKTTGWAVTSASTTTYFDFGDTSGTKTATGYFQASLLESTDPGYSDETKAMYKATIAAQSETPLTGANAGYYLKVTATKGTAGNVTFTEMKLVELKENGAWADVTGKELYTVNLTAPTGANIKLADHDFVVAITAQNSNNTFSNLNETDTVTAATLTAGNYIVVNNKKYTSADATNKIEIVGDTIKSGTVKVEAGNTLTSSVDGSSIAYTAKEGTSTGDGADGVIVTFDATGIATITDLEAGEKVTITAKDGTVTTYERTTDTTDSAKSFITKTITQGDQKTVWTTDSATTAVANDIVSATYGVSPVFSWPTASAKESVGYFKVTTSAATITETPSGTPIKVTAATDEVIRAVVEKTDKGYTITSLKLLQGQNLTDITGTAYRETADGTYPVVTNPVAKVAITINAPSEEGITFALDPKAIVLPTATEAKPDVDRNVQLNIADAKAGQVFTGLDDADTVTTGQLDADAVITVNDVKFATAAAGTLSVKGDSTAVSGGFKLGKDYTINAENKAGDATVEVTMSSGDAMAVVVGGKLQSIYKLGNNETVVVEETNKSTQVVSKVTYTGKADGNKIVITRKTETDGVTTYATATIGDGEDILGGSVVYETTGTENGVSSKFDWTQTSGSGYFQLTDKEGKLKADTLSVATQTKAVKIGKSNVGEIYAKVSLSADNTLSGITLWQVQEDGTLASVTALSDSQKVNVVITAPAEKLTADLTAAAFNSADTIQINGVAAESSITLGAGDSMTTAALTAKSKTVTVDGKAYQAGGNTVLKFTNDGTATVLQDGIVTISAGATASFFAAGGDSKVATDNITVTATGAATTNAVITVVNGVVTNISGTSDVTVGNATYTYDATNKLYDVAVTAATGTLTLAALAEGAEVDVNGTKFASGAADNSITVKVETTPKVYNGVVRLTSSGQSIALTDGDATVDGTDDITVSYTTAKAAGSGTATVKVHNGTIQSITGLAAGETLTVVDKSVDKVQVTTTYTASATSVTRKVVTVDSTGETPVETTVETTATLLAGGDVFTANYYSAAGDTDTALVGQFSWKEINGRAIGYFAVTEDKKDANTIKATVVEQPTEVIVTPPKSGSKKYLVASAQQNDLTFNSVLTLGDVLSIDSAGKVTTTAINSATVGSDSLFTITAPSDAIEFAKPATNVKVAIKNLAAGSTVSGLIKGDTVTTAALDAGEWVTIGGATYQAAAKGALTFIGEGNVVAADGTVSAGTAAADISGAALLSGTIILWADDSAKLAGGSATTETGVSDDVTVTAGSTVNKAVVKVANGVVTSITGLTAQGQTVTVTNASGKIGSGSNAVEYSGATIVYTCIDTEGKMFKRTISTTGETPTVLDESFLTAAKAGGEIASGGYKAAVWSDIGGLNFSNTGNAKTTFAYYKLDKAITADITWSDVPANSTTLVTKTNATTWGDSATDTQFVAEPDESYLKVTAKTTKDGVTTISSVDIYNSGATGALTKNAKQISDYEGTLTIDGTSGMTGTTYDTKYAVINYTLTKNGTFDVVATNVSYKSKFVNLGEGDMVTTAQITADDNVKLESGTYNIYHAVDATATTKAYTEARSITVKSKKGDGVSITTNTDGTIATLTDLFTKGESVTITEQTAAGVATTVYEAKSDGVITRTQTLENGTKTIATTKAAVTATTNILALPTDNEWVTVVDNNTVVSDFDWTLRKNTTGYFKVAKGAATAKVQKTTITGKDSSSYIAVSINANGTVSGVEQMRFDTETGLMAATTTDQFAGKLNITAPTANEFTFDRGLLGTSIDTDNTTLNITGIIADSVVSSLTNNDTVTTAKLKKETSVSVNGETYTVGGNGGALGFKVQDVSINGEDYAGKVTLTSGTALLSGISADAGYGFVYVGKNNLIEVATGNDITVTASTNNKGVSSFTIGDLDENESFTVNGYTYVKSGTNLVRKYNDAAGAEVTEIYANNGAKTVTSANLTKASNWKSVAETLQTDDTTGAQTSKYGVVTANLALADTRFTADRKAADAAKASYFDTYDYVLDKYVNSATKASTKALNGYVVDNAAGWQSAIGSVSMDAWVNTLTNTTTYTYHYQANSAIGQAIKVAAEWSVEGSDNADIITGAAKGKDFIRGGLGKDTIALSGAEDTVAFNLAADGQNVVTGYASGKDKIVLDDFDSTTSNINTVGTEGNMDGAFDVHLDNTKAGSGNVYLYVDSETGTDETTGFSAGDNYVMLKGMGNGKAVTINDRHFYFGNGYTSTKGATFAYEDGAYYVGNTSKKNGLKVTTDKTKYTAKTLGEDVVIDLMAKDSEGHSYYTNINTVDASASANRVVLSASSEAGAEITLKGGTYQSTLKSGASNDTLQGGSGQDMFWFDDLSGSDTVKSYTAGKDYVYIGGKADLTEAGYKVSASGKDVVISKGNSQVKIAGAVNAAKAVTVSTDGKIGGESVSYFVGKSGAKVSNTFTYVDGAYYVGNDDTKDATSTAKYLDTLKVTGTVKTAPTAKTKIDLSTSQYQSIEAVDASTLKAGKNVATKDMGVDVTASANGTRFTGTAYDDAFTCGAGKDYIVFKTNQGSDTITDFGQSTVEDVIKLNGLSKNEIDSVNRQIKAINTAGGTGTITFEGGGKLTFANAGTLSTITAKNTTITSSTPSV